MRQYLPFCTSKFVSICTLVLVHPPYLGVVVRELVVAPVSIRQHTLAYVSIRQHTSEKRALALVHPLYLGVDVPAVMLIHTHPNLKIVWLHVFTESARPDMRQLRRCQYLYLCSSKASKLSTLQTYTGTHTDT